jgi:hypothetical protein
MAFAELGKPAAAVLRFLERRIWTAISHPRVLPLARQRSLALVVGIMNPAMLNVVNAQCGE